MLVRQHSPIGAIAARARADPSLILGSESSQQLTRASARGLRASELTLAASSVWQWVRLHVVWRGVV